MLQVLENLLKNYFGGVSEYWEQLIECLTAFALNPHDTNTSNKAIKHLKGLCEKLVEVRLLFAAVFNTPLNQFECSHTSPDQSQTSSDSQATFHYDESPFVDFASA